jgi:cytochrome P450
MEAKLVPSSAMDSDFNPAPPTEPHFDSARGVWVLSRYADVWAALREPALHQSSPKGETFPTGEDETARSKIFAQVRTEIAHMSAGRWRSDMEDAARTVMRKVIGRRRVDILGDVAQPWSAAVLISMSGAPQSFAARIENIAASLLYKKALRADPFRMVNLTRALANRRFHRQSGDAENRLDRLLEEKEVYVSKSMFMAVSQTLPSILAKSWLALMRNPDQMDRLMEEPHLMPNAVEELLRYAGIVHTLHRKAMRDIQIGGTRIARDDRVDLLVRSANFDPSRFDHPHQLDIARRSRGQLSLGAGIHACAGAVMVREAFAAMTPVFLGARPQLVNNQRIVWMGDSTLHWPLTVFAKLSPNLSSIPELSWL